MTYEASSDWGQRMWKRLPVILCPGPPRTAL